MQIPARSILHNTLYDPWFEHDGCGIGFVAHINGQPSHDLLQMTLTALGNQIHRGAVAADASTGDGSGVLTQIPRALLLRELEHQGVSVSATNLAVGMIFFPQDEAQIEASCAIIRDALTERGLRVLAWRDVPTNDAILGQRARETRPLMRQVLIERAADMDDQTYERTLFLSRKTMEHAFRAQSLTTYVVSLSSRTLIYKGLLIGSRLGEFYLDLQDPSYMTAIGVYHQRYSTNTFPSWERAQPFRMLSHNGEINTLQGNVNWMRAREQVIAFPYTDDIPSFIAPVIDTSGSDSAMLDNTLEMLVMGGRDIRHAMTMMVPEAWERVPNMDPSLRAFYQYHACLMEPWDGPAALTFCDGHIVGTTLDRNGLRPSRYRVTRDGLVISGSEAGVVTISDSEIVHKGNLGPGQMIAVDTRTGQFFTNSEIKHTLAEQQPYRWWVEQHMKSLNDLMAQKAPESPQLTEKSAMEVLQMAFGYTKEELSVILKPMLRNGIEPVGSMGDDTSIAVLSPYDWVDRSSSSSNNALPKSPTHRLTRSAKRL